MSELVRCRVCRGTKSVASLGMMSIKCPECRGVGSIEVEDAEVIESKSPQVVSKSQAKRLKVQDVVSK